MRPEIISLCMEMAIREAKLSTMRHRHGVVLVDNGGLPFAAGHNREPWSERSHELHEFLPGYWSLHAEVAALLDGLSDRLHGLFAFSAKISKSLGLIGNAKPCAMCETLLRERGIARVYYTNGPDHVEVLNLASNVDRS